MRNVVLIETMANGLVVEYPLDASRLAGVKLVGAKQDAGYTVIDQGSGASPEGLVLKRQGDDLDITIDEEMAARLEDFYCDGMAAQYHVDADSEGGQILSSDGLSDAEQYGHILAMLFGVDSTTGSDVV